MAVIEALAKVCKDHHADLAGTLIRIFCHYKRVLPIVNSCLAKSIEKEGKCTCVLHVQRIYIICTMIIVYA